MSFMFSDARTFNQPIGSWDTSSATDMSSMFRDATTFNQGIGSWDMTIVMDMSFMFSNAASFNQEIGGWDTVRVTNLESMFKGAASFNRDISDWNMAQVTTMRSMFGGAASFTQDIIGWDIGSVTDMSRMFFGPSSFNQDISGWDVSNVQDFTEMFGANSAFNQDLRQWNENPSAANTLPSAAEPCGGPEALPSSLIAGAAAGGGVALLALAAAIYGVRRRARDENKLIGSLLRRQNFEGFISHYKSESGPSARILKTIMKEKLGGDSVPFLDSDNLTDLGKLLDQLRSSKALIVILSTSYMRRPFCLAELAEACRTELNIISVRLIGVHEFDFQEVATVTETKVRGLLDEDEWKMLEEEGVSLSDVVAGIKRMKQIIALPFSPNESTTIQSAEVDEIIAKMHEKVKKGSEPIVAVVIEDKI